MDEAAALHASKYLDAYTCMNACTHACIDSVCAVVCRISAVATLLFITPPDAIAIIIPGVYSAYGVLN